MTNPGAFAPGIATLTDDDTVLDAWFPEPEIGVAPASGTALLADADTPADLPRLNGSAAARGVRIIAARIAIAALS